MLKLMKYEYKKNRGVLLGLILLVAGLELYFLISYGLDKLEHMGIAAGFLVIATMVCFFMVFILGITNYQKELGSKSSYLIFMTPNSSLKIIVSKLLYILVLGCATFLLLGSLAIFDIRLVSIKANEKFGIMEIITELARGFGVNLTQIWTAVLLEVIYFVISVLSVVAIAYLAVTLSATFLQNNRFKGFISVVLFIILMLLVNWIDNHFIHSNMFAAASSDNPIVYILPPMLYNAVIVVASVFGCSALLDKAVSL
ncbi:MAG: hypothetical protein PUF12_11750 [Thermoflexaceae bacterium]|nr:hypothetical protein [Thermoflexaceae bacterium]